MTKKALLANSLGAFLIGKKLAKCEFILLYLRDSGFGYTESEETRQELAQKECWQQILGH